MPGHSHRAGSLRQTNKRNKRSKASKRSLSRAAGGKVVGNHNGGKKGAAQTMAAQSKADRRNQQQQKRNAKRQELLRQRRGISLSSSMSTSDGRSLLQQTQLPPRVVGIISLGANAAVMENRLRDFIVQGADRVIIQKPLDDENAAASSAAAVADAAAVLCKFDIHKKQGVLSLLNCRSAFAHHGDKDDSGGGDTAAVLAALDLARVCDLVLMVIDGNEPRIDQKITEIDIAAADYDDDDNDETSARTFKSSVGQDHWDHLISDCGDRILTALKSQGLPTPLTVLAHTEKDALDDDRMTMQSMKSLRRSKVKRQLDLKKYVSRFATTEFGTGNDKVVEVDLTSMNNNNDDDDDEMDDMETGGAQLNEKKNASAALVRTICSMSASPSKWIVDGARPFIISDSYQYDPNTQELCITGFVRGPVPLDVNSLVHVPRIGTYSCKCIKKEAPPLSRKKADESMETSKDDILFSDPEMKESTEMFAVPDSLEGEQNLIGFDDANDDDDNFDQDSYKDEKFARPAGWSDYQSAWLDAVDEEEVDDGIDHGELAEALNQKPSRSDGTSTAVDAMELDDANEVSMEEKKALLEQRRKEQSEHQEFPDEVQVDEDVNARDRFARYRSLKSFRKSYWDPKESLPETYSTLFHFKNFKTTQRSVKNYMKEVARASEAVQGSFWGSTPKTSNAMQDSDEEEDDLLEGFVPSGSYVTLTLEHVPVNATTTMNPKSLLTAVSLLEHENKVSVLHMNLSSKCDDETSTHAPVKSKDTLIFRCGWRTWKARPVFSQHNLNCDKHKFERFLPQGGAFFAASVFGPVTYTPCPVLVFRETPNAGQELVAVGSMIGADADRIVVKRIILTGYPVRVHKRYATVKYMFYNPDDVKWFKPAGLYTKHGLQGNILQSVGEHGTMKCLFNAPIKQHDTVCLPLYKRIYPKYAATDEHSGSKDPVRPSLDVR